MVSIVDLLLRFVRSTGIFAAKRADKLLFESRRDGDRQHTKLSYAGAGLQAIMLALLACLLLTVLMFADALLTSPSPTKADQSPQQIPRPPGSGGSS